jgi:osmotically-inducible protein OsmY
MRVLVLSVFVLTLSGCSGLMVSGGSTSSSAAQAERAAKLAEATDAATSDRVKSRIAADAALGKETIYVSCRAGMVRISGSVSSYDAREKAEKLAMATDGVKAVDNKITVEFSN